MAKKTATSHEAWGYSDDGRAAIFDLEKDDAMPAGWASTPPEGMDGERATAIMERNPGPASEKADKIKAAEAVAAATRKAADDKVTAAKDAADKAASDAASKAAADKANADGTEASRGFRK